MVTCMLTVNSQYGFCEVVGSNNKIKRGNPKLISGALLPSFILNYILIRVKERGFE